MSRTEHDVQVALVTAPNEETGARIARAFLEERLAACVNLVPGLRSLYRWRGRVEDDAEVLLIVKTRADRLEALERRLAELHPYEVPELIALAVTGGSAPYLDWVRAEAAP